MIKGLMGSTGVIVDGGNNSLPYHSPNSGDSFSGVLRLNGSDIQYYSNGAWNNLPTSYATVRLDAGVESVMNWVRDKQAKEASDRAARQYMERRAAEFPSLQKALEAIDRAEDLQGQAVRDAIANFHILDKIAGESVDNGPVAMQAP
jgi:hypothetical protein